MYQVYCDRLHDRLEDLNEKLDLSSRVCTGLFPCYQLPYLLLLTLLHASSPLPMLSSRTRSTSPVPLAAYCPYQSSLQLILIHSSS